MTTATQIIVGAAEEIGVKSSESALEAGDFQVILDRMNDLGVEWADANLTPAYTDVFNGTDAVNIERNAVSAFKLNLAIRIAPTFERIVTPALANNARESLQMLQASVVHIGPVAYPDTLPLGSGNECGDDVLNRRFFGQNKVENF